MALVKTAIRIAVVGGLVTGVGILVAGPERVMALAGQARNTVNTVIDSQIDDPVALRAQLRSLEAEYPKRIADVRGDLGELNSQLGDLERDKQIAQKVIEMASADRDGLSTVLTKAEAARESSPYATIHVRFDGGTMSLDQAYARGTQINNTINAYTTRAVEADRNISFLSKQKDRLDKLLTDLETERAQFQAQVWQLDNQIEMIARNDKLINMVEALQKTLDKYDRYDAVSLDQVTKKMAKIRAEQEARLHELANSSKSTNYEEEAKQMLQSEEFARTVFEKSLEAAPSAFTPDVIEVTPDNDDAPASDAQHDKLALSKKIVVER